MAPPKEELAPRDTEKLIVIWSSADPGVAHNVCFMYTHNAKRRGWFDDVTLIVWGPSAELASHDKAIQTRIREMITDGVVVEACKACFDSYGASDALTKLGVDVRYMGIPLTDYLKEGRRVLTF